VQEKRFSIKAIMGWYKTVGFRLFSHVVMPWYSEMPDIIFFLRIQGNYMP
jgi:hypothetical protein